MENSDHSDNLIFLTNRVGRQLARQCLSRMTVNGFEPQSTHVGLLADLMQHDHQRQQDLAITGVKDKATVARSVHQLVEAELVTRETDPVDRRQKIISLTPAGRDTWAHAQQMMADVIEEATAGFDKHEIATCQKVLFSIYNAQREETQYAKRLSNG